MTQHEHVTGIVGKRVRLREGMVCFAYGPRVQLDAQALTQLKRDRAEDTPSDQERLEFKTWLGLRYDRPAVPTRFEQIPKMLLKLLKAKARAPRWDLVRDVLVYYDDPPIAGDPMIADLWAVLRMGADSAEVKRWLTSVRDFLGESENPTFIIRDIRVRDAANTPLALLETYFALDSAKLSLSKDDEDG